MLFNSYPFIFLFFPIVFLGFFAIAKIHSRLAAAFLTLASLFFYGWWNPKFLSLLLFSIVLNYAFALCIHTMQKTIYAKPLLISSITINLLILAIFKYANFFINSINFFSHSFSTVNILLPLGISFFTFTQIAFLVDVYRGIAKEYNFLHYVLFVSYFPHLIAGPILHHKQMMPQFALPQTYQVKAKNISVGLSIFIIGLTKKILLADGFAVYANAVFDAVHSGLHPSFIVAWTGAFAYAFQLYFDFSGYSDMALGISQVFGITLPINFNSPYKALNIIEFWRRWHISLSQFLREYLYIPLGGNRLGKLRRYINLFITMLLGGLWHGANWTFVIWGGLHGIFLIINHGFRHMCQKMHLPSLPQPLSILITFLVVVVTWVFFRADNFQEAISMLSGMMNVNNIHLPMHFYNIFSDSFCALFNNTTTSLDTIHSGYFVAPLFIGLFIIWVFPNAMQLLHHEIEQPYRLKEGPTAFYWQPSFTWAFFLVLILSVDFIKNFGVNLPPSPFLYFQF